MKVRVQRCDGRLELPVTVTEAMTLLMHKKAKVISIEPLAIRLITDCPPKKILFNINRSKEERLEQMKLKLLRAYTAGRRDQLNQGTK